MGCASYSPKYAATAQPNAMPMMGDHRRRTGGARNTSAAVTIIVASAVISAPVSEDPSGVSVIVENMMGMTVAAISIITVPQTTGVKMRRSSANFAASANWNSDDTTMRLAIVAGPALMRAAAHTAMNAPDVPMMRMCPAPILQTRAACNMVARPLTNSAANAPQARYSADWSAIRNTIATVMTTGAMMSMAT